MSKRMTLFVATYHGDLMPLYSSTLPNVVREMVMQGGEFTVHDKWEKAERHGWAVAECSLTIKRKKPNAGPSADGGKGGRQ